MTSAVTLVRSSVLYPGTSYAYASAVSSGSSLVFLAGACPLDADGQVVARGDHAAQAAACVGTMTQALADAGARLTDVASTRVLVASADRADLVAAWQVVREAFGEHDVPSTLVGVTVLGYPDQLVEIEAVAALPG